MSKKCAKCGAPISGWLAFISKLAGVKQSTKDENLCNKCEDAAPTEVMVKPESELVVEEPTAILPEIPVMPTAPTTVEPAAPVGEEKEVPPLM
jgi:hypothetical protein